MTEEIKEIPKEQTLPADVIQPDGQPLYPYTQSPNPYAQHPYGQPPYGQPIPHQRQVPLDPARWEELQQNKKNAENIVNLKWFRIFWLLLLVLCILLIESFFKSGIALGTVILFVMAEILVIFFAKYTTGKLNIKALFLVVPLALINIGHLLFYSEPVHMITWPAAFVLFAIQLTYLSKPDKDRLFDFGNIPDFLRTVFSNTFVYIPYPFKGLKFSKERNKSVTAQIIIGVLISVPIAAVLLLLFSSADESFAEMIKKLAENFSSDFGEFVTDLILGAIICIFVSAAFVGANARVLRSGTEVRAAKEVSNVILGTILLVVAVVVALYVGIQFNHWFGNVPVNYIQMDEYSNLARAGFFELVIASCIILALIITVVLTSTKRDGKLKLVIKSPLFLLCACNLIVLYSAVEKMAVYIGRSGITSSRILVLWFIAVIVVIIIGIIIKIIRFSFKAFNFSCIAVIALVCGLSFSNMDYYVAKNHVFLAENHIIQNLEKDLLSELSYAAAGPLASYKDRLEKGESVFETTKKQEPDTVIQILDGELLRHKRAVDRSIRENPVMGFNFSRQNALKALQDFFMEPDKTASINVMLVRPENWERVVTGPVISEAEMDILDGSTATIPITAELFRQFYGYDDEQVGQNPIVYHTTTHSAYMNLIECEYRYYYDYVPDLPTSLILVTGPSEEETEYALTKGLELDLTPIAMDGFVFITHKDNPVDSLTIEQIQGIYSGRITHWDEVGGEELRIRAYQREPNSGSQTAMEQMVMQGQDMRLPIGMQEEDNRYYDMGALVDAVAEFDGGPASIGYTYFYYINNLYKNEDIKVINVNGIMPTNDNLLNGAYPFATYYYAVIRSSEPGKSPARKLRDYLCSPEGQDLISMAGYCRVIE